MNPDIPCTELSRFRPASPYAAAKVYAHHLAVNYRDSYKMFVACGIGFNHESERRGIEFVTRKITLGVADIFHGRADRLYLGRLDTKRDWGFAGDYVDAMWRMLQADMPGDFVIATGETHSVQEFAEHAFAVVGLDWKKYVRQDERFIRPLDPPVLLGDATKARDVLEWKPTVTFDQLVKRMVEHDVKERV